MATLTVANPSLLRSETRPVMSFHDVLTDGDATWKAGEFLRQGADGLLYEGTTGAASGVGADEVHYFATDDLDVALSADTDRHTVGLIHQDDQFEINELDGTVSEATVGQWYDMDVTSNVCTLNLGSSSHAIFEVIAPTWREETYLNDSADVKALAVVKILERTLNAVKV